MRTAIRVLIAVLFVLTAAAFGEKRVSGIIETTVRWKAEEGPYILDGDLLIARWGNLTIYPGTRIIISDRAQKTFLAAPIDRADSTLVSIRIQGTFNCVGRRNNPIVFETETSTPAGYKWRGLIVDETDSRNIEIAFTEISGATTGLTIINSNVLVRNSAFENNNVGIHARNGGAPRLFNNLIANNFTAGIKVERANPRISNNIIVFNRNLGLWCDNFSRVTFRYNGIFGNGDGNFQDCDPELGVMARAVKNRDSTDINWNIVADPVFVGSPAYNRAVELDVSMQTDSAQVRESRLIGMPNLQFSQPRYIDPTTIGSYGRELSKYSPLLNAGDPAGTFRNVDGTRNTMGPVGGPDFMQR